MHLMIKFILRVDEQVIHKDSHKFIQIAHQSLIYELLECSRSICQSKRDHMIFICLIVFEKWSGLQNLDLDKFDGILVICQA